ncbi:putative metal-binding motif-containing protein, partial [Myxococcota bacterium]|nr:putative metal-binding motif-containing protein [Myxococcota bacterium]
MTTRLLLACAVCSLGLAVGFRTPPVFAAPVCPRASDCEPLEALDRIGTLSVAASELETPGAAMGGGWGEVLHAASVDGAALLVSAGDPTEGAAPWSLALRWAVDTGSPWCPLPLAVPAPVGTELLSEEALSLAVLPAPGGGGWVLVGNGRRSEVYAVDLRDVALDDCTSVAGAPATVLGIGDTDAKLGVAIVTAEVGTEWLALVGCPQCGPEGRIDVYGTGPSGDVEIRGTISDPALEEIGASLSVVPDEHGAAVTIHAGARDPFDQFALGRSWLLNYDTAADVMVDRQELDGDPCADVLCANDGREAFSVALLRTRDPERMWAVTGAPRYDGTGIDTGRVYLFDSAAPTTPPVVLSGLATRDLFGATLAAMDLDEDGVDELVIAAPGEAAATSGTAWYLSAPRLADLMTTCPGECDVRDWATMIVLEGGPAAHLGTGVAAAYWTRGDYPDLLLGAPSWDDGAGGLGGLAVIAVDPFADRDGDCALDVEEEAACPDFPDLAACDPAFGPGAQEVLCDGLDQDCSGADDVGNASDHDGDGFSSACGVDEPMRDCDDQRADVHPGAAEVCDGLDNGCSEDFPLPAAEPDLDGDGVPCGLDCDDVDPARGTADAPCTTPRISLSDGDNDGYLQSNRFSEIGLYT